MQIPNHNSTLNLDEASDFVQSLAQRHTSSENHALAAQSGSIWRTQFRGDAMNSLTINQWLERLVAITHDLSLRARLMALIGAMLLSLLVLILFQAASDEHRVSMSIIVVIVAAWVLGPQGGILVGVASVVFDMGLVILTEGHAGIFHNVPDYLPIIFAGAAVGGMQAAGQKWRRELFQRRQAEEHLVKLAIDEERAKLITDFVTNVSHDFRTPLTAIMTAAYLLEKTDDPASQKRHTRSLQKSVQRLSGVVNGLLTLTTVVNETGMVLTALDLNALIRELNQQFQSRASEKQLLINLDLDETISAALADRSYLSLALSNLMQNAVDYTPDRGNITVRTFQKERSVVVQVCDTGIGISQDDLPFIFDCLYRADKARGTQTGGVGLGLAVAKRIVERHNGWIGAKSEGAAGQGATFSVWLPVAEQAEG